MSMKKYFKKSTIALVLILGINAGAPALISADSYNDVDLSELIYSLSEEEQEELSNLTIELNSIELAEFNELVDNAKSMEVNNSNARSAALGAYITTISVAGFGTIAIYAGGIVVAGVVAYMGSVLFNKVKGFVMPYIIGFSIPKKLRKDGNTVDLGQFKDKNGNTPVNKNSGTFTNGRWSVDKDTAGHGGRKWKIKNNGKRVASLDGKGNIIAD